MGATEGLIKKVTWKDGDSRKLNLAVLQIINQRPVRGCCRNILNRWWWCRLGSWQWEQKKVTGMIRKFKTYLGDWLDWEQKKREKTKISLRSLAWATDGLGVIYWNCLRSCWCPARMTLRASEPNCEPPENCPQPNGSQEPPYTGNHTPHPTPEICS